MLKKGGICGKYGSDVSICPGFKSPRRAHRIFFVWLGKGGYENKMKISRKDMLINVIIWAIGMIIILLIAYDPLDILDITQKVIIVIIMTIVLLPLLLYRRKRLLKKMKKPT